MMKAETQFTAILLMCGSPPPDNRRPGGFRDIEFQEEKLLWGDKLIWHVWAHRTREYAMDNRFFLRIEDWHDFLPVFLRWYDDQLTHCVSLTKEKGEMYGVRTRPRFSDL